MSSVVTYEKVGDVGKILINRPHVKNALSSEVLKKLAEAFEQSRENGDICVIFSSVGRDFSVGLDLKEIYSLMKDSKNSDILDFLKSFQEVTRSMLKHDGIIIGGLKGYVVGGAFEMTLSCDLRIASNDTTIILPELGIGMMFSNASTKLLPRIVGKAKAKEIFFLNTKINAEEAYKLGLVNSVVNSDSLMNELENVSQKILEKDYLALRLAKRTINANQESDIEAVLDRELLNMVICSFSERFKEEVKAFVEKRG